MKDIIAGIFVGVVIFIFLYPYFSNSEIPKSIDELAKKVDELTKEVRELRKKIVNRSEECEDENWYTELDDPKIAEKSEE